MTGWYRDNVAAISVVTQPAEIGRYQIRRSIGHGGMGNLYLAWDPRLDRELAIKVIRDDDNAETRERFAREARSAARLRHPNIVTIFDVGEHDGQPFIAMEFIQGRTLADLVQDRSVSLARRLELLDGLCDGLAFAHRAGLVHRDIKPANVMVSDDGAVKILDFGIARQVQATAMTQSGRIMGTLNYMSPEQLTGHQVDHRSDIFAVGAVSYELLSGRLAFPGTLLDGLYNRIVNEAVPALTIASPVVEAELSSIVNRALAKDPAARYRDLAVMRDDFRHVRTRVPAEEVTPPVGAAAAANAETFLAAAPPSTAATRRLARRRPVGRWLAIGAAAIVVAGLAWWLYSSTRTVTPPPSVPPPAQTVQTTPNPAQPPAEKATGGGPVDQKQTGRAASGPGRAAQNAGRRPSKQECERLQVRFALGDLSAAELEILKQCGG